MIKSVQTPSNTIGKNIIAFALLNFAFYIVLFIAFRSFNLLHLSGLRMLNFVILGLISCYQVDRWARKGGEYTPFLKAFLRAFLTGVFSFLFFAIFIFLYSKTDPYFTQLYFNDPDGTLSFVPFFILFFEGAAGSLVVALIVAIYSEKYYAKETSQKGV